MGRQLKVWGCGFGLKASGVWSIQGCSSAVMVGHFRQSGFGIEVLLHLRSGFVRFLKKRLLSYAVAKIPTVKSQNSVLTNYGSYMPLHEMPEPCCSSLCFPSSEQAKKNKKPPMSTPRCQGCDLWFRGSSKVNLGV